MRHIRTIALGILMITFTKTTTLNASIQIRPIELSQVAELKEMLIDCAFELWQPTSSRAEFARILNQNNEYEDLDTIEDSYLNNKGCFLVLLDNGKIVGAGAIRKCTDDICELKRMWFLPAYRGKGLGSKMAHQLFAFAQSEGYTKIRLDVYQPELQFKAMALYKKLGFYEIAPYNNHPAKIWMEKELTPNTIEIELRYEVLKPEQLSSFVAPLQKKHAKHDIDIYFDNPADYLHKNGIYIRTRNNKKLDIKFNRACLDNPNLAIQDYCEEHSFALPLQETDLHKINELLVSLTLKPMAVAHLDNLKSVNQFDVQCIVDKIRTSYQYDNFTICVDDVKDLGTFLEIELMADTAEHVAKVKQEMLHLIQGLDLKPIKTGYINLLLRKKDFAHYLRGRFILEEDRI